MNGGICGSKNCLPIIHSSIHSFKKYVLSAYSDTVLGTRDINGKDRPNPCPYRVFSLLEKTDIN